MQSLEWRAYGFGIQLAPGIESKDNLEVIAIDEASLEELGKWPWPRSILAVLVKKLDGVNARTIGITLPMDTAQSEFGVQRLDSIRDQYEGRYEKTVKDMLFLARQRLDTDGALAVSLRNADNTVLAISYGLDNERRKRATSDYRQRVLDTYALNQFTPEPDVLTSLVPSVLTLGLPEVGQALPPIPMLAEQSSAGMLDESLIGYSDGLVSPLVLKFDDSYYPSFSLAFAARSLRFDTDEIVIKPGQDIELGPLTFDTDPSYRIYPRLYEGSPGFRVHSFLDVYYNRIATDHFKGKDVLIGITAASYTDEVLLPGGESMTPLMINAHLINNLLHEDHVKVPESALSIQLAVLAVVALFLMFLLPRLGLVTGLVTSLLLLFVLVTAHFGIMIIGEQWIPLGLPTVALMFGVIAVAVRRKLEESHLQTQAHLFESNITLGEHLQSQGQFDQAFEKYRVCPPSDKLLERLYSLGLDFERRRQFNKAVMVFEHLGKQRSGFRDVKQRIAKNRELQDAVVLNRAGNSTATGTLIISDDGVQKPMLGRYVIDKEIGRGAMGMVYKGRDPKIGRTVAIKTMALGEEFKDDELQEVKSRFMREAESAGRLNHQNIVTIYDVGEEQELSYIAMDFLRGKDLENFCRKDRLLPLAVVLDIGIQVANALDFAHSNEVVHRDIKPANIIYDEKNGEVKVTDFGVAYLNNSSKTKTGTMLGTPYYMSPEQASGEQVDGRSDQFSLGITLYELTTGMLPFKAENLTGQIHKICNVKQVDVLKLREDVPPCLSRIINKSLSKKRDSRYASAAHMAKALRKCRADSFPNLKSTN